jgi:hypothetical protein
MNKIDELIRMSRNMNLLLKLVAFMLAITVMMLALNLLK